MAIQWYAAIDGDQKGPLTAAELKSWVWQGKIDHETFVKEGASGEWVAAGTLTDLFPDGAGPAPRGQTEILQPCAATHPIEWHNRRIAAVSATLAVLCWLAGTIAVLVFVVLLSSWWEVATAFLAYLLAWTVPGGTLGAIVGYLKRAPGVGAMLGVLFGPLGVIAALVLDNRPHCTNCSGPLEHAASTCPHCHAALSDRRTAVEPPPPREQRENREPAGELRTWTDAGGQYAMRGRFVRQFDDVVTLRYEDGSEVDVPLERLSARPAVGPQHAAGQAAGGRSPHGDPGRRVII